MSALRCPARIPVTDGGDPQYENFTAQELIDFRRQHISAEAINKIRTAKRKTQP